MFGSTCGIVFSYFSMVLHADIISPDQYYQEVTILRNHHIEMLRILTRLESTYGVIFRNFPMVPHAGIVLPKPILSSSHLHEKPTMVRFELCLTVKALKPLGHEPNYQSAMCFKLSLSLFTQSHSPRNNFQL